MYGWEKFVEDDKKRLFDVESDDEIEEDPIKHLAQWRKADKKWPTYFSEDAKDNFRAQEPVLYAPDRGPPILDFLSIFAAFVVAVIAAYYTIS